MALILLGSMFVVYQEFILFKNVLSWIGRKAVPMDLSYSLYAILVPLVVMIIKIPFSSPLDMFPKNNIWGALCFDFGFWHFMTALSLVYAVNLFPGNVFLIHIVDVCCNRSGASLHHKICIECHGRE